MFESICNLATGDEVYLGSDRVAARVVSCDLASTSEGTQVVLSYVETENVAAGLRLAYLPVTASVRTAP